MNTKKASFIYKRADGEVTGTAAGALIGLLGGLAGKKWVNGKDKKMTMKDALIWGGGGAALGGLAGLGIATSDLTDEDVKASVATHVAEIDRQLKELGNQRAGAVQALGSPTLLGGAGWGLGTLVGNMLGRKTYIKAITDLQNKLPDLRLKLNDALIAQKAFDFSAVYNAKLAELMAGIDRKVKSNAGGKKAISQAAETAMRQAARIDADTFAKSIQASLAESVAKASGALDALTLEFKNTRWPGLGGDLLRRGHGGIMTRLLPYITAAGGAWFGWDNDKFKSWWSNSDIFSNWYNPKFATVQELREDRDRIKREYGV